MVMQQELQLDALRATVADIERIIKPLPPAGLTQRFDGGWSILDVIGHIIAVDEMMFARCQLIFAEDNPSVVGHVPTSVFGDKAVSQEDAILRWRTLREQFCAWLAALPPGALNRRATHNERGMITIRTEVQIIIDHDTEHLNQIMTLQEQWYTTRKVWGKK
jgi:hypothetical protein